MFDELVKVIKEHTNVKKSLESKYRSQLREWIIKSTPLLNDPVYNVLTRAYWIVYGILDWADPRVSCQHCGRPFIGKNIVRLRLGYSRRCSVDCMNKSQEHIDRARETFHQHSEDNPDFLSNIAKKGRETRVKNGYSPTWTNSEQCKETKKRRYGDPNFNNIAKARNTRQKRYSGKWHPDDYVEKSKKTCLAHNGFECALSSSGKRITFDISAIRQKALQTMRKNFTYNKSKQEDKAYEMLCYAFGKDNIERQFKTNVYPYACDFYVKSLNVYLEFNGSWTHGTHAFDPSSHEDQSILEKWIDRCKANSSKRHNYYERAIYVWTQLDVAKRQTAKKNGLNFVEVWTIQQLQYWLDQQITK